MLGAQARTWRGTRARGCMTPSRIPNPWNPKRRLAGRAGEDLEGYAGAGLYDSITMDATEMRKVDYAADRSAAC